MAGLIELVAPARMGTGFRRLLAQSWLSNIGDGVALAAGPLLLAELTRDPLLISAAVLLQRLPWMVFALYAGVLADRLDRRRLVAFVNTVRAVVIGGLATTILTDAVNVWIALAALFVLGTAETFADIATQTLLPMSVRDTDLGVANARMVFGWQALNQLVGPPVGALLFGLGMSVPFVTQAVLVAAAARLVLGLPLVRPHEPTPRGSSARHEIAQGVRWLWQHGPMRTLTITIVAFNVTFGAAWAILVLYSLDHLGVSDFGYGVLSAVMAVGAICGAAVYGTIDRRIGAANIMRIGLVVETGTHLTLALTSAPVVAGLTLFLFGVHTGMWGTTTRTVRQRQIPLELQGRVGAVYMLGMQGGLVVGSPIGGALAGWWGLTAPFWFAFAGSAMILVLIWRELSEIAGSPVAETQPVG